MVSPRGCDASPKQVARAAFLPGFISASTQLYSWVERGTVRIKCLAQELVYLGWNYYNQYTIKSTSTASIIVIIEKDHRLSIDRFHRARFCAIFSSLFCRHLCLLSPPCMSGSSTTSFSLWVPCQRLVCNVVLRVM